MSDGSSSSDDEDYMDVTRPFILILNLAMTGSQKSIQHFAKKINYAAVKFPKDIRVAIAPPAPFIFCTRKALKQSIEVVSQNCCHEESGAFTGEVSASMLRNAKATGVLCGHWERRRRCGEDPAVVALQVLRATENRMTAFLCFGEDLKERDLKSSMAVFATQISPLFDLPIDWRRVVLVYEPVWSFKDEAFVAQEVEFPAEEEANDNEDEGDAEDANVNRLSKTGEEENDNAEEIVEGNPSGHFDSRKWEVIIPPLSQHVDDLLYDVRLWLRETTSKKIAWTTPILYGGHVNVEEGTEFARMKNIDGLLVTRRSLMEADLRHSQADEAEGDSKQKKKKTSKSSEIKTEQEEEEEEIGDFIALVNGCGQVRGQDRNMSRQITFDPRTQKIARPQAEAATTKKQGGLKVA